MKQQTHNKFGDLMYLELINSKTRPLTSAANPCPPQHLHFIITMVFV